MESKDTAKTAGAKPALVAKKTTKQPEKPKTAPVAFVPPTPPVVVPIRTINGAELKTDGDGRIELRANFARDSSVDGVPASVYIRHGSDSSYVVIPPATVATIRTGIVIDGDLGDWIAQPPASGDFVVVDVHTVMGEIRVDVRVFGVGTAVVENGALLAVMEVTK